MQVYRPTTFFKMESPPPNQKSLYDSENHQGLDEYLETAFAYIKQHEENIEKLEMAKLETNHFYIIAQIESKIVLYSNAISEIVKGVNENYNIKDGKFVKKQGWIPFLKDKLNPILHLATMGFAIAGNNEKLAKIIKGVSILNSVNDIYYGMNKNTN